jgi:hypothetical protein
MFGIPSPYLILGAVIASIAIYFTGHHKGWKERDMEMQVEIAKKNDEAREVERVMTSKLNNTATQLQEVNNVVAEKQTALDRAIRAGRVRISTPSCIQTTTSAAAPTGNSTEAGGQPNRPSDPVADAERETLAAIAAIIAQGDRNTAQLNACIDAYQAIREQINGNK